LVDSSNIVYNWHRTKEQLCLKSRFVTIEEITMPKKYWPIQGLLAFIWFLTGYFAFSAFGPEAGLYGALGNLLIGLILILMVNRSRSASARLYEGRADDNLHLPLLLLAAVPVICVLAGLIWWGLRLIGFFK
jgi:hypothetical protein